MNIQDNIKKAAEYINEAEAIVITAGAGIGVDSGLPDFRGDEGFWKAYPPIANLGISFAEMANPYWFEKKPELAWAFYGHRLNLYREINPHKGFSQLLKIAKSKPKGYFVYTSNVDGQFQKAGFDDNRIEECHGSIHHMQCTHPCTEEIWSAKGTTINIDETVFEAIEPLPTCPKCGRLSRPNILMFGDWNWITARTTKQAIRLQNWLDEINGLGKKLVVIEFGAGKAVPTVRMKSQTIATRKTARLIRVNPRDYDVRKEGQISIPFGAAEGCQKIFEQL